GNSLDLWHLTTDHRSVPAPSPRFSLSPLEFRVARDLRAAFPELSAPTLSRASSHSNRGLLFHDTIHIVGCRFQNPPPAIPNMSPLHAPCSGGSTDNSSN